MSSSHAVWSAHGLTCARAVLVGPQYGLGAFVEYASVPWDKAYPIPDALPLSTAAAGLTQGTRSASHLTSSPLACWPG